MSIHMVGRLSACTSDEGRFRDSRPLAKSEIKPTIYESELRRRAKKKAIVGLAVGSVGRALSGNDSDGRRGRNCITTLLFHGLQRGPEVQRHLRGILSQVGLTTAGSLARSNVHPNRFFVSSKANSTHIWVVRKSFDERLEILAKWAKEIENLPAIAYWAGGSIGCTILGSE